MRTEESLTSEKIARKDLREDLHLKIMLLPILDFTVNSLLRLHGGIDKIASMHTDNISFHHHHAQHLKHKYLAERSSYDATVPLSHEAKEELRWRIAHLNAWNGRLPGHTPPKLVIETAPRMGWGR